MPVGHLWLEITKTEQLIPLRQDYLWLDIIETWLGPLNKWEMNNSHIARKLKAGSPSWCIDSVISMFQAPFIFPLHHLYFSMWLSPSGYNIAAVPPGIVSTFLAERRASFSFWGKQEPYPVDLNYISLTTLSHYKGTWEIKIFCLAYWPSEWQWCFFACFVLFYKKEGVNIG